MVDEVENKTLDSSSPALSGFSGRNIQDVLTLVATVGGIVYAAGYVIVSSKLLGWGISEVNLAKARYVSVGLMFFINIGLVVAIPCFWMSRSLDRLGSTFELLANLAPKLRAGFETLDRSSTTFEDIKGLAPGITSSPATVMHSRFFYWAKIAFSVAVCYVITVAISVGFICLTSSPSWAGAAGGNVLWQLYHVSWPLLGFWFLPLFVAGLLMPLLPGARPRSASALRIPDWRLVVAGILFCVLVATRIYANYIFTHISPAVGGGDFYPVNVVPVPAENGKPDFLSEIFSVKADHTSKRVWLFDESDEFYFFVVSYSESPQDANTPPLPPCGRFVKVDKKSIRSLIY